MSTVNETKIDKIFTRVKYEFRGITIIIKAAYLRLFGQVFFEFVDLCRSWYLSTVIKWPTVLPKLGIAPSIYFSHKSYLE